MGSSNNAPSNMIEHEDTESRSDQSRSDQSRSDQSRSGSKSEPLKQTVTTFKLQVTEDELQTLLILVKSDIIPRLQTDNLDEVMAKFYQGKISLKPKIDELMQLQAQKGR